MTEDKRDDEHALAVLAGLGWCERHQRARDQALQFIPDLLVCAGCQSEIADVAKLAALTQQIAEMLPPRRW